MIHLHLTKQFWNLNILKLYFEFIKKSHIIILKLWMFLYVDSRLSSFQLFSHQFFFTKRIFSLLFYKTDFLVLKFKCPILKPKVNLLN